MAPYHSRYGTFLFLAITNLIEQLNITPVLSQDDMLGLVPCPTNSKIKGFTNSTLLFQSMKAIYDGVSSNVLAEEPPYVFILCPETKFDMDDGNSNYPLTPIMSHTYIICGVSGASDQSCVFDGGLSQVELHNVFGYDDVYFVGITFQNVELISVNAYGLPESRAMFLDCHWKNNNGGVVIYSAGNEERRLERSQQYDHSDLVFPHRPFLKNEQLWKSTVRHDVGNVKKLLNSLRKARTDNGLPQNLHLGETNDNGAKWNRELFESDSQSMHLEFRNCSFSENYAQFSMIRNRGGIVVFIETQFDKHYYLNATDYKKYPAASLSFTSDNGRVHIVNSTFTNNHLAMAPFMLDSTSHLDTNTGNCATTANDDNDLDPSSVVCEGVLKMDEGATCFFDGACPSKCIKFDGDASSCSSPTDDTATDAQTIIGDGGGKGYEGGDGNGNGGDSDAASPTASPNTDNLLQNLMDVSGGMPTVVKVGFSGMCLPLLLVYFIWM